MRPHRLKRQGLNYWGRSCSHNMERWGSGNTGSTEGRIWERVYGGYSTNVKRKF